MLIRFEDKNEKKKHKFLVGQVSSIISRMNINHSPIQDNLNHFQMT